MRMQSILVKPFVLDCLNRFEKERLEVENGKKNEQKQVVFASTKRQLAKLHQKMLADKENQAQNSGNTQVAAYTSDVEESDSESSEEEDEDKEVGENQQ